MTDQTPPSQTDPAPDVPPESAAASPADPVDNLFALKLLVVFLGVVLVVAAITFVILLILKKPAEEASPAAMALEETGAVNQMHLDLAPGEEIVDMSMGGRHLALRLRAGEAERLVIIDPETGTYRAIVTIAESAAETGQGAIFEDAGEP